ncbi:adenylosuccinate lyase [Desulfonatronum thiosulfatophilum]|uniref:Adenylosuccinate lyase n=1 Tax=Desulfonatronum thiosulfatophilum TaxID=617002 RepID=A0A1G6AZH9_9BACT|nr:adenylosuccinate lyase [Desulfonatronum thiosulfatophilum]SDB13776.1 adenylosuccinate lyase [Desulfonatronum thiosulfatophilum]
MIDRYTLPEMGRLWTIESRFQAWLEVELAICEGWHVLGVIPDEDIQSIRNKAGFDLERILEIEERTKHDVIAFLTAVEEKTGPSARYIHLGCTSSDIVDTANALLLVRAGKAIASDLDRLLEALRTLAWKYKTLPAMGRTHGIHAEPITLGLKFAGFYAEFDRHRHRWHEAVENIRFGKISGAVGTYAHLEPELESLACERLGLKVDPISTQIIQRDRYAQYFTTLAVMAGGVERLCVELRHLQRTEVREIEEGFGKGQKGSSAMPHKKNPISAENLSGLSRLLRSNALAALENMALWHERDISHSSVERVIMPDSTILMDYMLHRLTGLISGIQVHEENITRNLNASQGLFFSQRVLLALIEKGLQRQEAYELVQALAMQAWEDKTPFADLVRKNARVVEYLSSAELGDLFDLSYFFRHVDLIFHRVFPQDAKH